MLTRKHLSLLGLVALSALILAACGSAATPTPPPPDSGGPMTAPTQTQPVLPPAGQDPTAVPTIPEPGTAAGPHDVGTLGGTSWTLTQIDAKSVDASIGATLVFDAEGRISGKGGCNGFGGSYTVSGSTVTFSDVISTLMACDDARMAVETPYLGSLQGAAAFVQTADMLTLTTASGARLTFAAAK